MLLSRLKGSFRVVCGFINPTSFFYSFLLSLVLFIFISLRVPYIYGLFGFVVFLFVWITPLYLSFVFSRLGAYGLSSFLRSFVPSGSPLWIAPFVALAETVSYLVRPVVLLIRPFLKITIGAMGGSVLGSLFFQNSIVLLFLSLLFFYEIFVALVHWFIVSKILSFRRDH